MRRARSFEQVTSRGQRQGLACALPQPQVCGRDFKISVVEYNLSRAPAVGTNQQSWQLLGKFDKPVITLCGNTDPVSKGFEKELQAHIPGEGVGHFLPEQAPQELAS